ncbi:hypothetical protein ACOJCM_03535 [Billgrantia sp. LNSP4103-1]|uniref:hypothetical protein n=1 Tax=Billgrantia sp. LNSP4103-1 TaxID=3410266 RepID=UPI00403F1867
MLIKEERASRAAVPRGNKTTCLLALLLSLAAWLLIFRGFDIHSIEKAEGTTREHGVMDVVSSNGIAELMARHDYFYQQASTILELHGDYCGEVDSDGNDVAIVKTRSEALCNIFTEAVEMVGSYPRRLGKEGGSPQALFRFDLLENGEEKTIGPFLSHSECSVIAARLVQFGEQVTSCLPYEEWRYELFFAGNHD